MQSMSDLLVRYVIHLKMTIARSDAYGVRYHRAFPQWLVTRLLLHLPITLPPDFLDILVSQVIIFSKVLEPCSALLLHS